MNQTFKVILLSVSALGLAGCATWSSGSVKPAPGAQIATVDKPAAKPDRNRRKSTQREKIDPAALAAITVTENDITDRPYDVVGDIKVTVNKTTIFNKDPTHEQVDDKLRDEAAKVGANAVILVRYGTVGIGLVSWGSLDGQGRAVKFK
jgi:uncharacterized protein YbjQ (UPF0145 family)